MRILDNCYVTKDEQYNPEGEIARRVEAALRKLGLDTYNSVYIIRITVDKKDETDQPTEDDN